MATEPPVPGAAPARPVTIDRAALPRLHPGQPAESAAPAAPGITVTIGRIEVLPPAAPRPAPQPESPRRAPTAPALGDYLRERSRR